MISCWGSSPRPGGWPPARRGQSWPRSPSTRPGTPGHQPEDQFAPIELGFELHLTPQSAAEQMQYASAVARRLPRTFAALAAGQDPPGGPADHRGRDQRPGRRRRRPGRPGPGRGGARPDVRRSCGPPRTSWSCGWTPKRPRSARRPPAARRTCAGSGRPPATPGWSPASCRRMRCWRPGSTWSSGPWTCARPGCPAPLQELRVRAYLDLPAPRGAVPYRPCSGQRREELSLDLMAYSSPKGC